MRAAAAQRASEAEQRAVVSQSLYTLAVSLKQHLGILARARNRNAAACAARTSTLLALIDRYLLLYYLDSSELVDMFEVLLHTDVTCLLCARFMK